MELEQLLELLDDNEEAKTSLSALIDEKNSLTTEAETLRKAREKAVTEAKKAKQKAQAWEGIEATPEKIQEILTQQSEAETNRLKEQQKWEELYNNLNTSSKESISARDNKIKELEATVKEKDQRIWEMDVATDAISLFSEQRVANPRQFLTQVQSNVIKEDGGLFYQVNELEKYPLDEYVSGLKKDPAWQFWFLSSVGSGTGVNGNGKGSEAVEDNPWKDGGSVTERSRIRKEDPAKAERLKAAANAG
jgi:regulator of replication initiation timing